VRRFGYFRDSLFLASCGLYAVNRWLLKPHVASRFLHGYFNDLLLIPCALPPLLWVHRQLRLRPVDAMPRAGEITLHLFVWCVLFEILGPRITPATTADPWDVATYAAGAIVAGLWWRRDQWLSHLPAHGI
jgi:hypothetical protein